MFSRPADGTLFGTPDWDPSIQVIEHLFAKHCATTTTSIDLTSRRSGAGK